MRAISTTSPARASHRFLLAAIAIGTTLAPLNSTMIAVALPEIQDAFGVSVTATAWLVMLYLVAMAVGQPIGGRLGDLYGRRTVYLIGLSWFAIASIGCVFAPNLLWLIVFRTQQALAGALTFPNGAAMVRDAVPTERRGTAFGIIGLAAATAAASGPPIGGALVHAFGWPAIFWANVPVIGIAILLGLWSLPRHTPLRTVRSRFDLVGTLLFAASLAALISIPTLLRLDQIGFAILAGIVSVGTGWLFAHRELGIPAPVVDMRLFRQPHFAAACASICLSNLVMYTTLLAIPLFLERARDRSVQESGLVLAALSALAAFCGPLGGRWSDRRGRWLPAVAGASALFAGTALLTAGASANGVGLIVVALTIMGLGLGISGAPVQTAAVEAVPEAGTGSAAGIFSTARYLGSVVGSTILALAFARPGDADDGGRFIALFAVLAVVALVGIVASSRITERRAPVINA